MTSIRSTLSAQRKLVAGGAAVMSLMATISFAGNCGGLVEQETRSKPLLIAHRGASGYAPEHTLAAYRLAIEQGADFVEQDIQVTKDGVLVCLHDADLARTTNVAQLFPSRASERDVEGTGRGRRGWYVVDFTLAEIKQLDAGGWFNRENGFAANPAYAGLRVPTLKEVIESIGDRAGLYIELKHYPFYLSQGLDSAQKLVAQLNDSGFDKPGRSDRVFIQSFSKDSLLRLQTLAPAYRRVQLLPMEDPGRDKDSARVTQSLAKEIAAYAAGVGPAKALLKTAADVDVFHAAGLLVHPYTFRGPTTAVLRRPLDTAQNSGPTVRQQIVEDIKRYIQMGIDGGFTDYPALWREAVK
jgi:glycerophosphoryl diester phosphodiesterase